MSLPFVQMARERKIPVIAEAELGYRYTRCPIAAITGTNGKTTTTALMGAIFRRAGYTTHVTGNIGLPISQVALDTQPGDRMAFEASSFMLEAIDAFRPKVSAILNITEDSFEPARHDGELYQCKSEDFLKISGKTMRWCSITTTR